MSYTEQLERDTERTRIELANTIEELRERLTPGEVLDEILDYASDGDVGDYLRSLKRQVIANPLPLSVMGASMAWLAIASAFGPRRDARGNGRMMRGRAARKAGDAANDVARGTRAMARDFADGVESAGAELAESARATGADFAASARSTGADFAESARAAGAGIADSARRTAQGLGDGATEWGADAMGRAGRVAHDARDAATRAGDRLRAAASGAGTSIADQASRGAEAVGDIASGIGHNSRAAGRAVSDFAREQPLIVAAAGLVLGAIIGALLPSTETEDRLIGETSDAAKEKFRDMAGEQYAKVKDIATHTAEAALAETGGREPSARDGADRHEPPEFGPGPGVHPSAADSSGDHATSAEEGDHAMSREEPEHTHAGGN